MHEQSTGAGAGVGSLADLVKLRAAQGADKLLYRLLGDDGTELCWPVPTSRPPSAGLPPRLKGSASKASRCCCCIRPASSTSRRSLVAWRPARSRFPPILPVRAGRRSGWKPSLAIAAPAWPSRPGRLSPRSIATRKPGPRSEHCPSWRPTSCPKGAAGAIGPRCGSRRRCVFAVHLGFDRRPQRGRRDARQLAAQSVGHVRRLWRPAARRSWSAGCRSTTTWV